MGFYSPRPSQTERTTTDRDTAIHIIRIQTWHHFLMGVLGYGAYLILIALLGTPALAGLLGLVAFILAVVAIAVVPSEARWWVAIVTMVLVVGMTELTITFGPVILEYVFWEHWQWAVAPLPILGMESLFYGRYRFRGEVMDPHGMSPPRSATQYDGLHFPGRWIIELLMAQRGDEG